MGFLKEGNFRVQEPFVFIYNPPFLSGHHISDPELRGRPREE